MCEADILTIHHTASGASMRIHPYGATILSFVTKGHGDHLFVSDSALLDGSKPVRGGIPLVFPIFGPPSSDTSTMPQHGFARRNTWTIAQPPYDTERLAGVVLTLDLKDVGVGRGENNPWAVAGGSYDCTLQLAVEFCGTKMKTELSVKNTGTKVFPFQSLLHTYYKIQGKAALNGDVCFVKGLEGYTLVDKVTKQDPVVNGSNPITIDGEVDRVYNPPAGRDVVHVTIGVANGKTISMTASGQVDGAPVPISCVVWNPHKGKAAGMSDFSNDQYHEMLCVEPGILDDDVVVEPGKTATLTQTVAV